MIQFNEYLIGEDDKPVENLTERHQLVLIILDLSNSMAPYQQELDVPCSDAIDAKIFVIDDTTHSTMLLAEEY